MIEMFDEQAAKGGRLPPTFLPDMADRPSKAIAVLVSRRKWLISKHPSADDYRKDDCHSQ